GDSARPGRSGEAVTADQVAAVALGHPGQAAKLVRAFDSGDVLVSEREGAAVRVHVLDRPANPQCTCASQCECSTPADLTATCGLDQGLQGVPLVSARRLTASWQFAGLRRA